MPWTKVGTIRPVLPTYATTADAQAAVASGELTDGAVCIIVDAS